jgi:hypothetical protein
MSIQPSPRNAHPRILGKELTRECLIRVIRDWGEPAASPVTSAAPPKAEVNSEQ